jgi:hypothetical protein
MYVLMAGAHRYAIDYIEQAPMIVLAAECGTILGSVRTSDQRRLTAERGLRSPICPRALQEPHPIIDICIRKIGISQDRVPKPRRSDIGETESRSREIGCEEGGFAVTDAVEQRMRKIRFL